MKKTLSFVLAMILLLSMIPTSVIPVSAETSAVKMIGDLDRDEEITDWDGVLLARHLAGWAVTVADEKILDIDGDGEITDWDGVMFDRHLAGWSVETQVGKSLTYSITYANTMGAANTNPASYENGGAEIQLSAISAEHYAFAGWYIGETKVTHIPTDGEGDLTITARWTPVEYTISYANTKGAINNNPTKYHIESDNIVLQNLVCEGYRFDGWYLGNEKVTDIPIGSTGNITLTAAWTACDYTITYKNTKDAINNNPNGFTTDSAAITLTDLEKEGYTFDGWYNGNTKVTAIPSGTVGNIALTAQWTPISYTATFTADGSVVATRYFTIEDSVIPNIPNVPSKAGYTGAWSNYSLGTSNVVIPAVYTLNEYTITYANTKGAENSNPNNYTVITSTFRLSDLQCDGYDFIGWYKGNTKITSIDKGTTGNITLTAKWSPVDYVITYTDTKGTTNTNPVEYDVETGTIYLTGLVAEHYTFSGWYWNGKKVTSIPAGNIGDIELVARWTPVSYSLTYQNTKGATNTNPAAYTVEDMIILQDIRADGYTFDGWYYNGEKVTAIPAGSYGSKTLTAKWTAITYSITYQDEKNLGHNGPDTYTVESNTIQLPTLSAAGYTFDGWYNGNTKVTSIKAGSIGDLVLTAKWTPITYTITYQDTKDQTNNNPTSYTIEDGIVLQDLPANGYRLGYIFEGWYSGDEKVTEIQAGSQGNLVLKAKWSLYTYTIKWSNTKDAYNPNITSYTIEDVANEPLIFQDIALEGYRFDGWTRYNDGLTYSPGGYIHSGSRGDWIFVANWTELTAVIKTAADFDNMRYEPDGIYQLGANITISSSICDADNPFTGYFDGQGYTIGGCQPFGVISGTVTRLKTEKALADKNKGTISYCIGGYGLVKENEGTIDRSGSNAGEVVSGDYVGGLVAKNSGTIKESYSKGAVGGKKTVGGLVGYNTGRIENSYTTANVVASDATRTYAGGLIGENNGDGSVYKCYASGAVYSYAKDITSGYSTVGEAYAAGLFYKNYGKSISYCFYGGSTVYARGTGESAAGAISCGAYMESENYYPKELGRPAYDTGTTSSSTSYYGTSTSASNFRTPNFIKNTLYWDASIWRLENGQLPVLAWEE